jgi:hypothetical protein
VSFEIGPVCIYQANWPYTVFLALGTKHMTVNLNRRFCLR